MAKQSRLDASAIEYRATRVEKKNKYGEATEVYDANSAISEDGNPEGKGIGKDMGYAVRDLKSKGINYSTVITTDEKAGGEYDKNGTKGVDKAFQGDSGRNWGKRINIYNADEQYGPESVDIDTTVKGQFITK